MDLRKKFTVALTSLLICLILMISASYAWLSISRVPEVTSIETNIGANGSLEIALLSNETYIDPSLIRAMVGDSSAVKDTAISNLSWGNVVDLTDDSYGLSRISLYPAQLNVTPVSDGDPAVGSNLLMIPGFGLDGRFSTFSADTVSAVFTEGKFTYFSDDQNYGVRAIGTISGMTSQQAALAGARTAVRSYTSAALSAAESLWQTNGPAVTDILFRRYTLGSDSFTAADVSVIRDTAVRMQSALRCVDSALRQGIVGFAASRIGDEETFKTLRTAVENPAMPLSTVVKSLSTDIPADFMTWITGLEDLQSGVKAVITGCDALPDGGTWAQIEPLMDVLIDADKAYMGQHKLSTRDAFGDMTVDNLLTLKPNAGAAAQIAAYTGNYDVFFMWTDTISVEVKTTDAASEPYLAQISALLEECEAASGAGVLTAVELDETYGYAIDMAFRCNADCDLLLQTAPTLRVDETTEFPATQGGGSYMRFTSGQLDTQRIVLLMDAIRIGFLDNQNTLIAMAKLNTSNFEETEEGITAPLYLYAYTASADGSLIMGERRDENSTITTLTRNTPAVITVVVWLDGGYVDNSLANYTAQSMEGLLNLQFASSADLHASDQPIESKD